MIREALERSGKVGLGQVTMRGREYLAAVKPSGRGMLLETMRYASELRAMDDLFARIPETNIDRELVNLALELIGRKSRPFDAAAFKDQYNDALRALVEEKRSGKAILTTHPGPATIRADNIINIMDALRRSVQTSQNRGGPEPARNRAKLREKARVRNAPPKAKRSR